MFVGRKAPILVIGFALVIVLGSLWFVETDNVFWDLLKRSDIISATYSGFFSSRLWPLVELGLALIFCIVIWVGRWQDIRDDLSEWSTHLTKPIGILWHKFHTWFRGEEEEREDSELVQELLDVLTYPALPFSALGSLMGVVAVFVVAKRPELLVWIVAGVKNLYQLHPKGVKMVVKYIRLGFWCGLLATLSLVLAGLYISLKCNRERIRQGLAYLVGDREYFRARKTRPTGRER